MLMCSIRQARPGASPDLNFAETIYRFDFLRLVRPRVIPIYWWSRGALPEARVDAGTFPHE